MTTIGVYFYLLYFTAYKDIFYYNNQLIGLMGRVEYLPIVRETWV